MTVTKAAEAKGLHAKLAEVMAAVGHIPKNGQGPGYKFVAAADVADKIRDELAARKVTCLPAEITIVSSPGETTISGKQSVITIRVRWQFTDGESGETVTFESVGTGADSTDKAAPKAQTNAMKYAFLMAFAIPTGDDPEAAADQERQGAAEPRRSVPSVQPTAAAESDGLASEPLRKKLLAKCSDLKLTEPQIKGLYVSVLGPHIKSSKQLTRQQVEKLLEWLDDPEHVENARTVEVA